MTDVSVEVDPVHDQLDHALGQMGVILPALPDCQNGRASIDPLRQFRADPGKTLQFFHGRVIDVDRRVIGSVAVIVVMIMAVPIVVCGRRGSRKFPDLLRVPFASASDRWAIAAGASGSTVDSGSGAGRRDNSFQPASMFLGPFLLFGGGLASTTALLEPGDPDAPLVKHHQRPSEKDQGDRVRRSQNRRHEENDHDRVRPRVFHGLGRRATPGR